MKSPSCPLLPPLLLQVYNAKRAAALRLAEEEGVDARKSKSNTLRKLAKQAG